MNPNQTVQNLKRKFSLIAQKNSVPYTNENGEFDETWIEKFGGKRIVSTSYTGTTPQSGYIPIKLYPNIDYFIGNVIKPSNINPNTIYPLYDLTLTDLPDSPYPIGIYFKTGATFSGITATQIKAWIGNTTLNPDSCYKLTIANLIGTIEELTIHQQI